MAKQRDKRSVRADVRNPVLGLPALEQLQNLDADSRTAIRSLLLNIRSDAQVRAENCWRKHKAPMAAYWKAVAVYAGHIARALRCVPPKTAAREQKMEAAIRATGGKVHRIDRPEAWG
jgi:tartrate dehydratase beta subunit/fumarate hydratase class I family protein